ncbi:MAG: hypothetical protein OXU86_06915 [Thaumarchaeota archaeon]|nr:hypothetical protein [Paracoccaceae bacterium]MDD9826480.1 hypothetical protein [Nitrososphaerota archaeon]RNJ72121.1 MAG: hypothetical protein EB832_04470 [Thaumarchaeota archaeon S14]RNJ73317.1 MAG: hypothetical protein EB833_03070 [Thaumarchaeota archaeon S13]RNJ74552.1 MAG: hypothetical protein EB824_03230 [Thaumarchaeota archaeon S15]
MAREISVKILPDGTLAKTPASKAAMFLRARYSEIQTGECELPFNAMKMFHRVDLDQIPSSIKPLSLKICLAMPRDVFEGGIVEFPGGVGIRETINAKALEHIAKTCKRQVETPPSTLSKIFTEPGMQYTHVLASPNAYTACMKSMGWDIYPTFLDPMANSSLRISPQGRAHRLAKMSLAVAIDYTVPDGIMYCIDARNMLLATGSGKITYDYTKEGLLIAQKYSLDTTRAGGGVRVLVSSPGA